MPIFEYKCEKCNTYFERFNKYDDIKKIEAEECPNEECQEVGFVRHIIAGKFLSVESDWKPPTEFNNFLKKLKANTPGAADFRTY